ncbi:glycosyltransferase family 2 protein [Qingshengfaniella alkalisoli]|uniref:Glycosyltransferase family 2 protein n=1 Tax=Qingshengfaniella alkalisoli TaxID=2599296 RepID=A0A5B8IYK3_9RHOB|nr:glycosyltransferase family 2 protein [Qingshengfaniella alkalisoli]QDY70804.1 glycosyltransferase family 2 protein [Qingshengfaniella alkalisoli]
MNSPKVSVVSAFYNRADYIRLTLDSLLAQKFDDYEIIIVNDGSPDPNVRAILDSYDDPRLRVIHQANTGFTTAIRNGIAQSSSTYIAIQGAGDVSFPNRLVRQVAFLDANPEYAALGCGYNNALVSADNPFPPLPVEHAGYNGSAPDAGQLKTEVTPQMIMGRNPFTHGEVMIRRAAYDAVGGYRTFFANSQDMDLWLRLIESNRLGVLSDWLYQRHSFAADGIATNLGKLLVQTAYTSVAERCWHQRQSGRKDDVEQYGPLALMRMPRTPKLSRRILRSVKQADYYGTLKSSELQTVRDLYGPLHHGLARALHSWLRFRRPR